MAGDFQDLIEALERVERGSADVSHRVKTLRQEPSEEKAQAVLAELRALERELEHINRYFTHNRPNAILDLLHALDDAIHGTPDRER